MSGVQGNRAAFDHYIRYEVDYAVQRRQELAEAFHTSSRWISASLFALNGGAMLALLQLSPLRRALLKSTGPVFLTGLVLSILVVMITQYSANLGFKLMYERGNRLTQLLDPSAPLNLNDDREKRQIRLLNGMNLLSEIIGMMSLGAFLVGVWMMAGAL